MRKVARRVIDLAPALKAQIASEIGCSGQTVRSALAFKTTGGNADLIRKKAKDLGGVVTTKYVWYND